MLAFANKVKRLPIANLLVEIMPQEVCLNCWYLWKPRGENPRECPDCHSRKTTSVRKVTDAVESVVKWFDSDPLLEPLIGGETNLNELGERFEEKKNNPLDLLISPFRAVKSLSAFQKVVDDAPLSPKIRLDVRRVILEIAFEFKERNKNKRIGDFVEEYIEKISEKE